MGAPAPPQPLLASTTAASGSAEAGINIAAGNKFAVMVETANGKLPDFTWTASVDNVSFFPVAPSAVYGNVFRFDCPAVAVGLTFSGNQPGNAIAAQGCSMGD